MWRFNPAQPDCRQPTGHALCLPPAFRVRGVIRSGELDPGEPNSSVLSLNEQLQETYQLNVHVALIRNDPDIVLWPIRAMFPFDPLKPPNNNPLSLEPWPYYRLGPGAPLISRAQLVPTPLVFGPPWSGFYGGVIYQKARLGVYLGPGEILLIDSFEVEDEIAHFVYLGYHRPKHGAHGTGNFAVEPPSAGRFAGDYDGLYEPYGERQFVNADSVEAIDAGNWFLHVISASIGTAFGIFEDGVFHQVYKHDIPEDNALDVATGAELKRQPIHFRPYGSNRFTPDLYYGYINENYPRPDSDDPIPAITVEPAYGVRPNVIGERPADSKVPTEPNP